jgi:hypothetical protein
MLGYTCGMQSNGCGGTLDCGTCTGNQTCGGGGTPNVCGSSCVPATCASLGATCGQAADGCGGLTANCGTCPGTEVCQGLPPTCSAPTAPCTGLCLQQTTCSGTATTSITGTVYAPNGTDPLYDTLVYVPNGGPAPTYGVQPFAPGVSCDSCSSTVTGSPLVSAVTPYTGQFTITNMPVGTNIPLVIQNGRWRRQVVIPSVTACVNTAVPAALTTMPNCETGNTAASCAGKAFGDIPLMAFATGSVDSLECVFRKIGLDDSEFVNPTGTGRVQFYTGVGSPGAQISTATPAENKLWGTQAEINKYDMVLFPCQGDEYDKTTAAQNIVVNYANAGGRIYATHYSYVWLFQDAWSATAVWDVNQTPFFDNDPENGTINQTFPKGLALAQWLKLLYPASTQGTILLNTLRDDFDSVITPPSTLWISITDSFYTNQPMHYSFNTPITAPAANQCGRVLYDDFHVEDSENIITTGDNFPTECACYADDTFGCVTNAQCCSNNCDTNINDLNYETCLAPVGGCKEVGKTCTTNAQCCGGVCTGGTCRAPMTPQEKMLEFMLFDLGSCVTPDVPMCTPTTCTAQNISCGPASDGCGNIIQCGTCPSGQTCGGGGVASKCGMPPCTPETCTTEHIGCGPAGDGCGNTIMCGTCPSGQSCGGGGTPGQCGTGTCTATTCATQHIGCGPTGDGCGNIIQCGACPSGQTCGGGGTPGQCGAPSCTPKTCATYGFNCGSTNDGCGNVINCGTCNAPQICGGGGVSNVCGGGAGG